MKKLWLGIACAAAVILGALLVWKLILPVSLTVLNSVLGFLN